MRRSKTSFLKFPNERTAASCHGPYLSREDISSLQLQIRVFKETKGNREASEERETRTKAKRAEKLYALFLIRSTEERGEKNVCLQRRLSWPRVG